MFLLISDTLLGDGVETLIKYQDSGRIMDSRPVLGLIEQVIVIGTKGMQEKVIARIDTGATSSSIDERLVEKLDLGPMLRLKLVKSASGSKRRPLICVKIKIDGKVMEEEFTVADRAHMTYQLLIGQNILKKEKFLIDPLKKGV